MILPTGGLRTCDRQVPRVRFRRISLHRPRRLRTFSSHWREHGVGRVDSHALRRGDAGGVLLLVALLTVLRIYVLGVVGVEGLLG